MSKVQTLEYKEKLISEIKGFKEKGESFLRKELTVAEFKGISGGMGVYAQKGGEQFMLRLRVSSGILSREYSDLILRLAEKFGIEKLHLTTRQAIQLHDLTLDEVCEIMEESIRNGLYTRGGGGNFPRNVALSPLSGVEKGEAFDVTPFAVCTGEYLMEHITEYRLPRKFKIAYSNGGRDNAGCTSTDLGFLAVVKEGKPYFKVYLAGGLGNNPAFGIELKELIEPSKALHYVEAAIRLFMAEGDYQNKAKARLRYVPVRIGEEAFLEAFYNKLKEVEGDSGFVEFAEEFAACDIKIEKDAKTGQEVIFTDKGEVIFEQKQESLFAVRIHPICGQFEISDFKVLRDFIEEILEAENHNIAPDIRLSMDESLFVRNLTKKQAEILLDKLSNTNMVTSLSRSISCVGTPSCQVGMIASQELIHSALDYMKAEGINPDRLPQLSVSGCLNSCARHQISPLGFTGIKRRVDNEPVDAFDLHICGSSLEGACHLGKPVGSMKKSDIPAFLGKLAATLENLDMEYADYAKDKEEDFMKLIDEYKI
jgi:sulfite reductase beta subunit-like hemoprotein